MFLLLFLSLSASSFTFLFFSAFSARQTCNILFF